MAPPSIQMLSMALSAMPVSPMPMMVGREVPDEITAMSGDHPIANSHDLWAALLLYAMERQDTGDNEKRREAQQRITEELFSECRKIKAEQTSDAGDKTAEKVYDAFSKFTRGSIAALSSSMDVRFAPLDSILREDKIHVATCHHCRAQDIVFGGVSTDAENETKKTAEEFSQFAYPALMMRQFARICEAT